MTQKIAYLIDQHVVRRELPDPTDLVMDGIRWGEHFNLFTPAYWVSQVWMHRLDEQDHSPYFSRRELPEEIVFCMLSGFGVTAELATAAFHACADAGLISKRSTLASEWQAVLSEPMQVGARTIKYRYPNQKAKFLANAMEAWIEGKIDQTSGKSLRDSLLKIKGCGHKTAGFIARNFLDSDDIAILDIHIVRAGFLFDLYCAQDQVHRQYLEMEAKYLTFCEAVGVRPAVLDCLIWDQMRTLGSCALDAVSYKSGVPIKRPAHMSKNLQLALPI